MNPLIKRTLPHLWNALVGLFIIFAAMVVLPKVREQFTYSRATPDMIAVGYVGIGALIGVFLCAVSVTSFFWFRVPVWFRAVGGLVLAALVVGHFRVSALYASSPQAYGSAVSFFGALGVFMFAPLVLGYGYPGLIQRFWRRS